MKFSAFALAFFVVSLWAQSNGGFDAVSIKPNRSGSPSSETNTTPGRLSLENVTTLSLLLRAFGVQASQIIDAPDWAASERYDVLAVTGGADRLTDKERQPFVRAMLEERFQMRFHRVTREMKAFALQVARNGLKLSPSGGGTYAMKVRGANGRQILTSTRGNIPRLVEILSGATGKVVVNQTRLDGAYDFTLDWSQDLASDAEAPSLTTALEDQLGLRLESVKMPVEVIVLDRIARPSAN